MPKYLHSESGQIVEFVEGSFYAEIADASTQWQSLDARPKRNGKHEDWIAYAIQSGVPSYEAANLSRDELVARMGDHPDVVEPAPVDEAVIVTDTPDVPEEG